MKNVFLTLFAATLLFACSKENRINRQLDGSWNVKLYENVVISPGTTFVYNFEKEKDGKGSGNYSITVFGNTQVTNFTYELEGEVMKYMVKDSANQTVTAYLNITDHSKKKMEFVNLGNGKTTTMVAR